MPDFFNKTFWQLLVVSTVSQVVVLVIAVVASVYITGSIEQLTQLFSSIDDAITSIERVVNTLDPAQVAEQSDALRDGAETIGQGIGTGGATVVDNIGSALQNFRDNN
jgi:ABC-type multidrug transport system fused ATPase/permease subunit